MKRIICSLLVFCLLLPALAFAAPSQKLQAIYDSVDTLNVEELVALQDYVNAKIDASSAVNTDETTYVLNKNTKKFHYADCASAKSIKDKNRTTYTGSRDEVIANGYQPCKKCNPSVTSGCFGIQQCPTFPGISTMLHIGWGNLKNKALRF